MAAVITAEGRQADGAQEPFDESPAPGPEDAYALTLGVQSTAPLPKLPLAPARYHASFLPGSGEDHEALTHFHMYKNV
jgi:hypothetical protein